MVAFALLTALSFALNAPLAIWEEQLWSRAEQWLIRFERDVRHPDQQTLSLGSAEYLVIGMGAAGQAAYDRLKEEGRQVVGMDIDPARIQHDLSQGRRVIYGDIQDIELWMHLDLSGIKSVILAVASQETKLNATTYIRSSGYNGSIYALTMREKEHLALRHAGANSVCLPINQAGRKLAELSLSDEISPNGMVLDTELNV